MRSKKEKYMHKPLKIKKISTKEKILNLKTIKRIKPSIKKFKYTKI
jgi:hypothetical protein